MWLASDNVAYRGMPLSYNGCREVWHNPHQVWRWHRVSEAIDSWLGATATNIFSWCMLALSNQHKWKDQKLWDNPKSAIINMHMNDAASIMSCVDTQYLQWLTNTGYNVSIKLNFSNLSWTTCKLSSKFKINEIFHCLMAECCPPCLYLSLHLLYICFHVAPILPDTGFAACYNRKCQLGCLVFLEDPATTPAK